MTNDIFNLPTPRFKQALCAEIGDPDLWFPEGKDQGREYNAAAKKVCFACVERDNCLNFALEFDIREGTWGGLTSRERSRIAAKYTKNNRPNYGKGYRAYKLQQAGLSYEHIANHLDIRISSIYNLIKRYKESQEKGITQ